MVRRRTRHGDVSRVPDKLPEHLAAPEVSPTDTGMHGLSEYMRDLSAYLAGETGRHFSNVEVVEVMVSLGIPPAEWYRAVLAPGARDRLTERS